jgi:AraC family transcriptional regulator
MNASITFEFKGVVPAECDAEAGQEPNDIAATCYADSSPGGAATCRLVPVSNLRSVMAELRSAIRSVLNEECGVAEDSLRRASEMLEKIGGARPAGREDSPGGLAAWQIRKVTSHIEANLERTIRNEELAALVRLTPSHFGRAFRNSVGEPPHEYVIRRRIERAQGLMLSTQAKLSDIALDCGLADQSHLTRLFRKLVGESPRAWRRARFEAPV